jgi:hypothetical protein
VNNSLDVSFPIFLPILVRYLKARRNTEIVGELLEQD